MGFFVSLWPETFLSSQSSIPELQLKSVWGTKAPEIQDMAEDALWWLGMLSEGEYSRRRDTKGKEGLRAVLTAYLSLDFRMIAGSAALLPDSFIPSPAVPYLVFFQAQPCDESLCDTVKSTKVPPSSALESLL